MAHAFGAAIANSPCMRHTFRGSPDYANHFLRWGVSARNVVAGKLGVVRGRILHLWHGDLADRRYADREREFRALNFNPERDLQFDQSELWEWSDAAPETVRAWTNNSFQHRNEDGERPTAPIPPPPQRRRVSAAR